MTIHHTQVHHTPATPVRSDAPDAKNVATQELTHEAIAAEAYAIYQKTGNKQGQCTQNWKQAEEFLRAKGIGKQVSSPAADVGR